VAEIDGVQVTHTDSLSEARAQLEVVKLERDKLLRNNASMTRKMGRVRAVAKELETVFPPAAILIEGALER
jgi:hypothetical protein